MPVFSYIARDRSGRQRADAIESPSREAVAAALRAQGLLPLKIVEVAAKGEGGFEFSLNPFDYRSLCNKDIEHEFHQIAVMLRSGISLLDALNLTAKHARIGARKTWQQLARRIQQGSSFHEALQEHPVFSEFTIQLVRVGEQTGYLHTVVDQAAIELKASRRLKSKILKALRYPGFTLLMAIGIVIFMLTNLVPEIKKLLKMMGKPMPPITQALIDTFDWVLVNGPIMLGAAIALAAAFVVLYHIPNVRWWMDRIALRLPVLGNVLRLSGTVLFARAMGLLLRSGVVIVEALETMEKLHANKYLASRVGLARERVLQGSSLAEPLDIPFAYMPLMLQMVRIGESSGTLDEILIEMTEYHDELLQQRIDTLTGMIAPVMTIFVGGVVGFVYAAFLVAMFTGAGGSPK
jgi:type II secretory pathway component PulF